MTDQTPSADAMTEDELIAARAADSFRQAQGLASAPILDLISLIEQAYDVDIAVLANGPEDPHGVTMNDPATGVRMVAVGVTEHPMRWRSTLGHELGHLVFGDHSDDEASDDGSREERATTFSRHLLLPLEGAHLFAAQHGSLATLGGFSDLVQRFAVSPVMAARQLLLAGLIDHQRWLEWSALDSPALAARYGWSDFYAALQRDSREPRAPQRLLARVITGYLSGVVGLQTVAGIRGISVQQQEEEFVRSGLIRGTQTVGGADASGTTGTGQSVLDDLDELRGPSKDVDLSWLDDQE